MLGMEARGNSMDFKGKTALVTGGVSGIGFGIARAFCVAGIDLVLTYRNEDYRAQAQAWFEGNDHPMPRFVQLDVTDRVAWARVADRLGPVHILVNNAGVSVFGPTDEASYADYDWIMGVNFGGVVNGLVSSFRRSRPAPAPPPGATSPAWAPSSPAPQRATTPPTRSPCPASPKPLA